MERIRSAFRCKATIRRVMLNVHMQVLRILNHVPGNADFKVPSRALMSVHKDLNLLFPVTIFAMGNARRQVRSTTKEQSCVKSVVMGLICIISQENTNVVLAVPQRTNITLMKIIMYATKNVRVTVCSLWAQCV